MPVVRPASPVVSRVIRLLVAALPLVVLPACSGDAASDAAPAGGAAAPGRGRGAAAAAVIVTTASAVEKAMPVQVRAADLEHARAVLTENTTQAASVDWDSVDVGEREDTLPLHAVGRVPVLARLGVVVAIIALLTMLVALIAAIV